MKLFVIWPEKSLELVKMLLEFEKHGQEIVYWVGHDDSEAYRFPKTIFHSYLDAVKAKPAAGVAVSEFLPPDTDLIEKLYITESLILTMLNLLVPESGVSERKHLYYEMVQYWFGVLKKYQPDAIIFPLVPHYVFDYLIYELAGLLNIKTVVFLETRIPGRLFLMNNFWEGSQALQRELEQNKGKNSVPEDLSEDIREYYNFHLNKNSGFLPPNIRYLKIKHSFIYRIFRNQKIQKSIKDGTFFPKTLNYLLRELRELKSNPPAFFKILFTPVINFLKWNLKKEYASIQSDPDLNKKFIFLALHSQPEQSSSPQGGVFVDQILLIETLAAALPGDWLIYVKEHPAQWLRNGLNFSPYKYRGYYETMAKIKNVRVVPMNISSYDLIRKSQAVASVGGAASWEAVLASKPAIIFGYPWYKDCPGVFKVNDVFSCRNALAKIASGFLAEQQKIINYLAGLDKAAIRGFISPSSGLDSKVSKEAGMKNITQAILEELKQIS